ncbi:PAS domain S-box protein [Caulobacter segnis]|uniref:Methyl-accepting chemotaxis sensory transducer with Pas/Pac sensor n=2 Tax=Caulobacter segnis TaxID=88688 RepID=D5VDW2_CAUST|nr:PAS domain-containing methyl-accepting chemotaxis protein [Caulobacter segnis]ADG08662.1 methyl-accepting chemotaxis sensory transducer with Pas/Pac sensor [Caulobacter segnis ATCC 21756]AVQ00516.1 PAS domain S-box protein [Caulobacter segnis]
MFGIEDKRIRTLRTESAELKATVTAIHRSQAVIEFQLDGTIIDANENFLATMGYTIEEIRGRHHSLFVDPKDVASPEYARFWERLRAGEFFSDAFRRVGAGGDEIWIQGSYNPVFDAEGKPYKVIKFASDITAVRREQEAARAEREKAAAVQDQVVSILAEKLGRLAEGDLTAEIDAFPNQYERIKGDFNRSVESLREALSAIAGATANLEAGSGEIASASSDLSRRTEQQAASLEETAAALDEITATVKRSAEGAQQASAAAAAANAHADRSGDVVAQAVAAMGEIENSSGQITRIIGVIDEIAFQTNLLALNAGVEAARAGEAGRGFAVVAQEVRALAQRSAEAAKEIKVLIASSTNQVERGVRLVGDTGEALAGIVAKVSEIDRLIREIAVSSQEQSTGLHQVNAAVNQMDQVTQQNAAMVEEATAAAANMSVETRALAQLVGRFRIGVGASGLDHRARAAA